MSSILKNVAGQNCTFTPVSTSTGGVVTGATPTVYITKDGTQAASAGTVTELKVSGTGYGSYNYAPTQAETNCTNLGILFLVTGASPIGYDFHTDVVDANGFLEVDVVDWGGTAISTPPSVNATQFAGQTITAAAGVTLPASVASPTNITAGTITTVTNLTNAPTAGDLTATMKTSVTTAVNAATTVGITSNRKKGTQTTIEIPMQNSSTGALQPGLTVSATITKDGGTPASTTNAVTEVGLGQYQLVLTATEMTANTIVVISTATGAVATVTNILTQP